MLVMCTICPNSTHPFLQVLVQRNHFGKEASEFCHYTPIRKSLALDFSSYVVDGTVMISNEAAIPPFV